MFAAVGTTSAGRRFAILLVFVAVFAPAVEASGERAVRVLTLEECLREALEKNALGPASRYAVAAAEARQDQASAGYWPQASFKGGFRTQDDAPNFVFPATTMMIPPQSVVVPGGTANVTIPANAFGPGFPPVDIQLPVSYPGQTVNTPAQVFPIPAQDIKLMDRDSFLGALDVKWLLYDGGARRGYREQASGGMEAARQEARRTDLEIVDGVKRFYYGAVLARQLHHLGRDTLSRMEATLRLTETMYREGAGKVQKTDYLDNRVMVETLRAAIAVLAKNESMAEAALANVLGMPWDASVRPEDADIPFLPHPVDLDAAVAAAFDSSPDWKRLEAGIRALEGAATVARSGYRPKIALTGEVHRWWNDYDAGMATDRNKQGWSLGLGFELPVFNGNLDRNRVRETRARLDKIQRERDLLREGIGLQVRDLILGIEASERQIQATLDAMTSAMENRELNTRAYQNELAETEDVIRAQLVEALMTAQHFKARYDHVSLLSRLELVIGAEIRTRVAASR